jgi:phosphatidylglycerol---prolipoprotein diacylglyceryl transferase
MNDAFHWGIAPEAFQLGQFQIRWYGLCFALAFVVGYQIIAWIYRREKKPAADLDSLFISMFLGTLLGARLGHCLFYEPEYYLTHPVEMLKVWHGGLASHGAVIGILIAVYVYSRKHKDQPCLWVLSRMTLACALGGAFIRLGNFFNSEIVGKPTDFFSAVIFTRIDHLPRHPAQLYESVSYVVIFALLMFFYRRSSTETNSKLLLGFYFASVFLIRFLIEFVKEPQVEFERMLPLDLGQLLSIPFIALGLVLLWQWWKIRGVKAP